MTAVTGAKFLNSHHRGVRQMTPSDQKFFCPARILYRISSGGGDNGT